MTTFTFDHVSLSVADLDTQRDFNCRAFGLVEEYHVEWPDARLRLAVLRDAPTLRQCPRYATSAASWITSHW